MEQHMREEWQSYLSSAWRSTPTEDEADNVDRIMRPKTFTSLTSMSNEIATCLPFLNGKVP